MSQAVVLESAALSVTVNPRVGGTITKIVHKGSGLSVLGTVPWAAVDAPLDPPAAPNEHVWLTRYTGGWPLLFPNGGDACDFAGTFHGFHGEASISPWEADVDGAKIHMARRFVTVPVRMRREIGVEDELVTVRESVVSEGAQPIQVMWGHHPTFGSDLLDGAFEIRSGARTVTVDQGYDPPTNPLRPGATAHWPLVPGKAGAVDLGHPPRGRMAALCFLSDFDSPWIAIRRADHAIAVALSWDASVFPYAWLWYELGGTADAPWNGRTRLIGVEPNSTGSANGLADAQRRGGRFLTLQPGVEMTATVHLQVFKPTGATQNGRTI
jgi:hypothetical protein